MKRQASLPHPKRTGLVAVLWAMLAQTVIPAHAVSTGYTGFVSQIPSVYTTPPDVNVMFTLDDSGSMRSDAIPDFSLDSVSYTGVPPDDDSIYPNGAASGVAYLNMWGANSSYLSISLYRSNNAIARYTRSSAGNPLYYDPTVTYRPWPQAADNKLRMAPADPTKVNIDPSDPTNNSRTLNLTVRQGSAGTEAVGYWLATYYVYNGATMPLATPNTGLNVSTSFTKKEIQGSGLATFPRAASRTDCTGAVGAAGCTRVQELQNFANWLQYYRTRRLMAKGGVGEAFARQGTNLRAGFARIGGDPIVRRGVRPLVDIDATRHDRTDFFNLLYNEPSADSSTPLRFAMDQVGKHFQTTGVNNPWAQDPGTSIGTEYACRRSFHVMSTDGFWNGDPASTPASNDNDSFSGSTPPKPDGTTYAYSNTATSPTDPLVGRFTVDPFKSGDSNTLADVAAYYWKTDLRTDIENRVAPSVRDPAFWQHLTTFTIGFGITGTGLVTKQSGGTADLTTQAARDLLIANKTALNWTSPSADDVTTGDDLVHASMNGRGAYFSATNPAAVANGLAAALAEAVDQPFDFASLAVDSTQVSAGSKVYQATFSPSRWYGRLYAFNQNLTTGGFNSKPTDSGTTNPDQVWEASNKMPAPASRNIFTFSGTAGADFTWSGLTAGQQTNLNNDSTLLDYLRGDGTNEVANGGPFRDRSRYTVGGVTGGVLGDVVSGSPLKGPDAGAGYDRLRAGIAGQSTYTAFRSGTGLDNMRNTIFLGANDGMLHAFNLTDGVERFGYVPSTVYNVPRSTAGGLAEQKLRLLADPTYSHRFTVDGPPNVADAYLGGAWKSVLVGSTGAGARGIFAMDVTNPVVGVGGFGTGKIMWEFSEANNTGMGFVLAYPHVALMRDGTWAVILGNGYDSVSGQAKLFLLNAATGAVIKEFAVGAAGNNGLSQPNFVLNAEREVTTIYAGDLQGNLWKFDVSDTNPSNWKPSFGTVSSPLPLFTTVNDSGQAQPISVMPEISEHPNGGAVISFGTGKLFETSDTASGTATPPNVNLYVQSVYGIWDKPSETSGIVMTSTNRATEPKYLGFHHTEK